MKDIKCTPTLTQPARYRITVPGRLDDAWTEWHAGMTMTVEQVESGPVLTTLTVTVDQAALQGLLRRLYAFGLPLLAVEWLPADSATHSRP